MTNATEPAVAVLTSKSFETMVEEGGCGHWVANEKSVLACRYVVATLNKRAWRAAPWEHGTAFMIGKIAGIEHRNGRVLIKISEFSTLAVEGAWKSGGSNPVRYASLKALRITQKVLDELEWKPWPGVAPAQSETLTIVEAKIKLAKQFGVTPEQIEITVKA